MSNPETCAPLLGLYGDLLVRIDRSIDSRQMAATERKKVAACLFDLTHEHGKGLTTLFEQMLDAPAQALMRIQFEAFVRAVWVLECATDEQIEDYGENDRIEDVDGRGVHFGDLLKAAEQAKRWTDTLSSYKQEIWNDLNSFTHGGLQQAGRRFDGKTIAYRRDNELVVQMVKFSALLSLLSYAEMVELSGAGFDDQELINLYWQVNCWPDEPTAEQLQETILPGADE